MSDRERLEKLAQDNERARQEALVSEQQRQSEANKREADLLAQYQQKTEEIFDYCKQQFEGHKLVPSGHEVSVGKAGSSRLFGIKADRLDYVALNISHWGEETNDFEGLIPVLLTRFCNGGYEIVKSDGRRTTPRTFDELREALVHMLSEMNLQFVRTVFEQVRRHFPSR